jgi:AcrR family transcriptional regulator
MNQSLVHRIAECKNDRDMESVRTEPQQRRSREKRDRVLAAAATLLTEVPYEEIGTRLIADRAGVSVGSLYRFFPDREAIFAALGSDWLDKAVAVMDALVADPPAGPDALVDRVVDAYAAFWRSEPGYRQVSLGMAPNRLAPGAGHRNDEELAERLGRVLVDRYGLEVPMTRLVLAINVGDWTLNEAFRGDPEGDPAIIAELKYLLRRWLTAATP